MSKLSISDHPEVFQKLGITDPKEQQLLLDYFEELFTLAIEHLIRKQNNEEQQHHP